MREMDSRLSLQPCWTFTCKGLNFFLMKCYWHRYKHSFRISRMTGLQNEEIVFPRLTQYTVNIYGRKAGRPHYRAQKEWSLVRLSQLSGPTAWDSWVPQGAWRRAQPLPPQPGTTSPPAPTSVIHGLLKPPPPPRLRTCWGPLQRRLCPSAHRLAPTSHPMSRALGGQSCQGQSPCGLAQQAF